MMCVCSRKSSVLRTALLCLSSLTITAAPVAQSTMPNETLRYTVNWPTGVSLGEATLSASGSGGTAGADERPRIHFEFDLDASVPGFSISDRFRSTATANFCSIDFQKKASQGSKKVDDKETFDLNTGTVTRGEGSGQSDITSNVCGKDALDFLYYLRRELAQDRVPPRQTLFFGAPYEIQLDSAGTETVKIGNSSVAADHIAATVSGPASNTKFDLYFLHDPARTLALVRVPLALGTFSMELAK
jgi:hypothetical protein